MKQVMAVLVLATFAGCVDGAVRLGPDVDPEDPEVGGLAAPVPLALDSRPSDDNTQDPAPGDPESAGCEATIMRLSLDDGSCMARVSVRFDCSRHTQRHTWARVGIIADDKILGSKDLEYTCRSTVVHTFAIPCDDKLELTGAATFDHPQTAEDLWCESPSFRSAP